MRVQLGFTKPHLTYVDGNWRCMLVAPSTTTWSPRWRQALSTWFHHNRRLPVVHQLIAVHNAKHYRPVTQAGGSTPPQKDYGTLWNDRGAIACPPGYQVAMSPGMDLAPGSLIPIERVPSKVMRWITHWFGEQS